MKTQEFSVSTEIYSLENIQQAIRDFSDYGDIVYSSWNISISSDSQEEIEEIFHEFMNYVISLWI